MTAAGAMNRTGHFGVIQGNGTQAGWTWINGARLCTLGTGLDEIFFRLLGLVIGPAAIMLVAVPAKTAHVAASFAGALLVGSLLFTFERGKT